MNRHEVRESILCYLNEFYSDFMLYKDLPVVSKIHRQVWALDMYEQLSDTQRQELYNKIIEEEDRIKYN
jgi:hypothetical protein